MTLDEILALRDRGIDARLVIQRSAMEFAAPLEGDFTATAVLPGAESWERFLATLARHRRARIAVSASVASRGVVGGLHEGTYAAMR